MLIELLLSPIILLVGKIFEVVNFENVKLPFGLGDTLNLVSKALMFFPVDIWVLTIANIAFWITLQFTWAIIEWIYKKIPGIN